MLNLRQRIRQTPTLRSLAMRLWMYSRDLPRCVPLQASTLLRRWSGRPTGYYLTTTDYLTQHPEHGWEKVVTQGGSYERVSPLPCGRPLPAPFAPPQTVAWQDERVIYLEDCRYWGEYGGSIVTHDERLVGELSPDVWGIERHAIFNRLRLPASSDLPGLTAVVSTPEASTNYSHWMMDLLPRLHLLQLAGFGPDKVDRYLVNLGGAPYECETLRLAGIPEEKIVPVSGASHFRCERIVTTSLRKHHWQHSLPAWVPGYLRGLTRLSSTGAPDGRRLYLTRRTASFRKVLNEDVLDGLLTANGFEVIDPGSLSVQKQAELFASASVIVSPHSSAMTNLVFCNPGTVVLEIFPADYFDVSFWTAATVAQCRYYALVGDRVGSQPLSLIEGRRQDLTIPPAVFAEAIAALTRQPPRALTV